MGLETRLLLVSPLNGLILLNRVVINSAPFFAYIRPTQET